MNRLCLLMSVASCVMLSSCMGGLNPGNAMLQADAATVRGVQASEAAAAQGATAQMYQAEQAVDRPGDDKLTCDQLQAEMVADINDPKVQEMNNQSSAMMKSQLAQQRAAMSKAAPMMAASLAAGMLTSMLPYGGNAASAASQTGMQAMQAQMFTQQAAAGEAPTVQMMQSIGAAMGPMMRGWRVMELAKNKRCAFMNGIDVPPAPAMPPGT